MKLVLTYMSIYDEINLRVNEGKLIQLFPAMPSASVVRTIFAAKAINDLMMGPWSDLKWEERCGSLRGDLDRFIEGKPITVAVDPFKGGKNAYMKHLHPYKDEVWEIRSRAPKPGIRVLGRFADTDVFVALDWWFRDKLGGPHSREWRVAIVDCRNQWRNLFPAYDAKLGVDIHDYISGDALLV